MSNQQTSNVSKKNQKFFIVFFLLLLGAPLIALVTVTLYYWHQATQLPKWYTNTKETMQSPTTPSAQLPAMIESYNDGIAISVGEEQLTQMLKETLTQTPQTAQILPAIAGLKTTIEAEKIVGGIVIQPSKLPPAAQEMAKGVLPVLGDRPIYVGIESNPQVENHRLILDRDTKIKIGEVNLKIKDIENITGVSIEQMQDQVNHLIKQGGFTPEDIKIIDKQLRIRGNKQ